MKELAREFWRQGRERSAPGLPVGLARVAMGIFWLSQFEASSGAIWLALLFGLTGVSLSLGLVTSVGAVCGLALSLIGALQSTPAQPWWPYALLMLIQLLLLFTRSGRNLGLDQLLVEKLANWPTHRPVWLPWVQALV